MPVGFVIRFGHAYCALQLLSNSIGVEKWGFFVCDNRISSLVEEAIEFKESWVDVHSVMSQMSKDFCVLRRGPNKLELLILSPVKALKVVLPPSESRVHPKLCQNTLVSLRMAEGVQMPTNPRDCF